LAECASVLADFLISLAALTTQREVLTSIFHNIRLANDRALADIVEKVENQETPKISQMSRVGDFSHFKAS
jgi:hypothetical protein